MERRLAVILVTLAVLARADPVSDEADRVLAAFRAKGDLRELAAKDDPDPWLVADDLCARGEHDAAEAFAKAAPRPDTEKLPAFVVAQRTDPTPRGERDRLARAAADAPGGATVRKDVVAVRLMLARAAALQEPGQVQEAVRAYDAAADAAEDLGWLAGAWRALWDAHKGAVFRHKRFELAIAPCERMVTLGERRGDKTAVAMGLEALSACLWYGGGREDGRALDCLLRARVLNAECGDLRRLASNHANLATRYTDLGDHDHAVASVRAAMEVCRTLAREDQDWLMPRLLASLGRVQHTFGHYAEALSALEEARALARGNLPVALLSNLGHAYQSLGDFERAVACLEADLAHARERGDKSSAAAGLVSLAGVYLEMGRHEDALATCRQALEAWKEQEGPFVEDGITRALACTGAALTRAGRHEESIPYFEEALRHMEARGQQRQVCMTLDGLGNAYASLGNLDRAVLSHERARAFAAKYGLAAEELNACTNLADDRMRQGHPREALALLRESVGLLPILVQGLEEEAAAGVRGKWTRIFTVGVEAASAAGDTASAVFFLESGRAMTLLESLGGRGALQSALLPEDLQRAAGVARRAEQAATARYQLVLEHGEEAAEAWKDVEAARERLVATVGRIQRDAKAQAGLLYPEADSLEVIRGALGAGEALVLYALLDDDTGAAIVVTPDGARLVPLGASKPILEAATGLQAAVARPDERGVGAPPHEQLPFLVRRLGKLTVAPLGLGEDVKRVLVSPDGILAYLPFALLLEGREAVYVPSATTYRLLKQEEGSKHGAKVLALGDPDTDAVPPDPLTIRVLHHADGIERLPATRSEAKAAGDVVLLDAEATVPALRDTLATRERWRAVHLACHGLVDAERPALSSLALAPGGGEDGFLRCLDVYRMRIPADLVVLSACETARGRVYPAEGVIGWTRAFLFAGAPRVIVSLWKVDDEATAALMEEFYRLWKGGGTGSAAALRKAQESVRSQDKWKHPYFWAAWQLWGLAD